MRKPQRLLAPLLLSISLPACTATQSTTDAGPDLAPSNALVVARPYDYQVPSNYDPARATPLVIILHGYGVTGFLQSQFFGLPAIVDSAGFLYAWPDGKEDSQHMRFWNATDACCDEDKSGVDDVAYLDAVIDDMSAHFHVDPKRIYLTGHSNGAYMAHRYACDRANRVAAIVALAGDTWKDPARCQPSAPVAVLQVHGNADESTRYDGGMEFPGSPAYPSAHASVATWATKNNCTLAPLDTSYMPPTIDKLHATTSERYTNCQAGGAAELWTIHDESHLPTFNYPAWPNAVWGWLSAHPRP